MNNGPYFVNRNLFYLMVIKHHFSFGFKILLIIFSPKLISQKSSIIEEDSAIQAEKFTRNKFAAYCKGY